MHLDHRTHEFVECQEERHRPLILSEVCPVMAEDA